MVDLLLCKIRRSVRRNKHTDNVKERDHFLRVFSDSFVSSFGCLSFGLLKTSPYAAAEQKFAPPHRIEGGESRKDGLDGWKPLSLRHSSYAPIALCFLLYHEVCHEVSSSEEVDLEQRLFEGIGEEDWLPYSLRAKAFGDAGGSELARISSNLGTMESNIRPPSGKQLAPWKWVLAKSQGRQMIDLAERVCYAMQEFLPDCRLIWAGR